MDCGAFLGYQSLRKACLVREECAQNKQAAPAQESKAKPPTAKTKKTPVYSLQTEKRHSSTLVALELK